MADGSDGDWAAPEQGPAAPPPPAGPPPPGPPPPSWDAGVGRPAGWGAPPPRQRLGLIPMYPMGVGDVLDTAFKLLRAAAAPSVLIVLVILGPVQVVTSLAFGDPGAILRDPVPAEPDATLVGLSLLGSLLQFVTAPLAAAALTWLAARTDEGHRPTFGTSLGAGARRLLPVLGALLVVVLAGGLIGLLLVAAVSLAVAGAGAAGGVLVGIPAFVVMLAVVIAGLATGYLVVPVIVVEELGPVRALRRLWRLVRPQFWRVLGVSLLAGIVFTLLGGAVSTVFSLLAFLPTGVGWVFVAVGSILDQMIRVPLGAFAALALYVDLRIRGEGYDIAVLASELRR